MNKEKFKELSFKQKIEWLLQYYGLTAVFTVIALTVAVIFIKSVLFPEPLPEVSILILSDAMTQEEANGLQADIEASTGHTALVSAFIVSDLYGKQAFSMKVTSDVVDIVVSPKEETDGMSDNGYLPSYEKIEGKELYIGCPIRAREGQLKDEAYDMVKEYIKNR